MTQTTDLPAVFYHTLHLAQPHTLGYFVLLDINLRWLRTAVGTTTDGIITRYKWLFAACAHTHRRTTSGVQLLVCFAHREHYNITSIRPVVLKGHQRPDTGVDALHRRTPRRFDAAMASPLTPNPLCLMSDERTPNNHRHVKTVYAHPKWVCRNGAVLFKLKRGPLRWIDLTSFDILI